MDARAAELQQKLFQALVKIKDDINRQIPLASNRYEQYECVPLDPALSDEEKQRILDVVDEKYFAHESNVKVARLTYHVYEHLNDFFKNFLRKKHVDNPTELSDKQKNKFKTLLLTQAATIAEKIKRVNSVLGTDTSASFQLVEAYLIAHQEALAERLYAGELLTVDNADYALRFRLNEKLVEHRQLARTAFIANQHTLMESGFDEAVKKKLDKYHYIWKGLYFDKVHTDVGFCDEHTSIGLKRIFQEKLALDKDIKIEVVSLTYLDDDGEPDDGHVFIVINRDSDSPLNIISAWGEKAILFDPWNKLVCYATDFTKLPVHYLSFPEGARWEVQATYDNDDRCLLDSVQRQDQYYVMTGNTDIVQRMPRIIEEHGLVPLTQLPATQELISRLVSKVKPDSFSFTPEFFITTEGSQLITPVAGFNEPKLAIHKKFLTEMDGSETGYTLEELEFGIAQGMVYIQRHWAGMSRKISASCQHQVDQLALEKSNNGSAAISFLRKQIQFAENNKDEAVTLFEMVHTAWDMVEADDAQRIKALMTLMALDKYKYLAEAENKTSVSDAVRLEIAPIDRIPFFKAEFNKKNSIFEKINYLITCLPELKIELMPYEVCYQASVRVRDFCQLLMKLKINFNKQQHIKAISKLIDAAYQLRISAFDEIYFAAQQVDREIYRQEKRNNSSIRRLIPLGIFAQLQREIDNFVTADTTIRALHAIERFHALHEQLRDHLNHFSSGYWHLEKYQKDHPDQAPTGDERFFGSSLGEDIAWRSFHIVDGQPFPWVRHVEMAKRDASGKIARALWHFGVQNYQPLWEAVIPLGLIRMSEHSNRPFVYVSGKDYFTISDDWSMSRANLKLHEMLIQFLASRHSFESDMLRKPLPFRERFRQFIDANWPLLAFPTAKSDYHDEHNLNNPAVSTLFEMMVAAATTGSNEDKQVVKDFFLDKDSRYSITKLVNFEIHRGAHLDYKTPYMKFIVDEEYQGNKFKLFSVEDKIAFLTNKYLIYSHEIPAEKWITIFSLPFQTMTLECLEQLIPLLVKHKVDAVYYCFKEYFKDHTPAAFSPEASRLVRIIIDNRISENSIHSSAELIKPKHFIWDLTQLCDDMSYLYRVYDTHYAFPDLETKLRAGRVVLEAIEKLDDDKKLAALEYLLVIKTHLFPLTDIQLRNDVVLKWVQFTAAKWGIDDKSDEYFERASTTITHLYKYLARRDIVYLFERLACAIEAQRRICDLIGTLVNSKKFVDLDNEKSTDGVWQLALLSKYLSEDKEGQERFLEFLISPITQDSLDSFATYLEKHPKISDYFRKYHQNHSVYNNKQNIIFMLHTMHVNFWGCTLEQRAVLIDYLLIPTSKVKTDEDIANAYNDGFIFISGKLFPNAADPTSDDHLAVALMKAYLNSAEKYVRSILLAGMLVASNESASSSVKFSSGKKIALMCEHMGPAYIKLAQAVHSHPGTPEHVRKDLEHIKGKANPPLRWDLWHLIASVIPETQLKRIKHVGKLLGSASYNLAMEVDLYDRKDIVLSLLRENARRDAKKGFEHLKATVVVCQHDRISAIQPAVLSILEEAKRLSENEMSKVLSDQQFDIAARIYPIQFEMKSYKVSVCPVKLLHSGEGYRFIDRAHGEEFNCLPAVTPSDKQARRLVALAVLRIELEHMFNRDHFDSDRHGNQLRVQIDVKAKTLKLGLYDFGEMSLDKPTDEHMKLFIAFISDISKVVFNHDSLSSSIEGLLSAHIDRALAANQSASHLMRIRKSFLALQDFIKELKAEDILFILKEIIFVNHIDDSIRSELIWSAPKLFASVVTSHVVSIGKNVASFFNSKKNAINDDVLTKLYVK